MNYNYISTEVKKGTYFYNFWDSDLFSITNLYSQENKRILSMWLEEQATLIELMTYIHSDNKSFNNV